MMLKIFGAVLAGATAGGALSACAAPQPKYAVSRTDAVAAAMAVPVPSPDSTLTYTAAPVVAELRTALEAEPPTPAPVGAVESAALPLLVAASSQAAPPPPAAEPVVQPASPPVAEETLTHVVGPGETLFAVGRRYGVSPNAVAQANALTFASTLRVGQRLRLPAGAKDRGAQAAFPNRHTASTPAAEPARRPTRPPEPARAALPTAPPVPQAVTAPTAPLAAAVTAVVDAPAPAATAPQPAEAEPDAPVITSPPTVTGPAPMPRRIRARYTATPKPLPPAAEAAPPSSVVRPTGAPAVSAAPAAGPASTPPAAQGRFLWPVRGEVVTGFGPRGPGQRNDGLNIAVTEGEPIRAAATGEVVYAGDQVPGFGKLILLKHPDGWVTAYAHLSEITVKMREQVRQGAEIGKAGRTGAVPSPQLHFEVRHAPSPQERARPVDPLPLLPQ